VVVEEVDGGGGFGDVKWIRARAEVPRKDASRFDLEAATLGVFKFLVCNVSMVLDKVVTNAEMWFSFFHSIHFHVLCEVSDEAEPRNSPRAM